MTEGNSSIIYRLINRVLNRHAVAMVLKLPTLSDAAKAEIQRLVDLRHRNIIKILDHDLSSYPFFVITEFICGFTLQKALETTARARRPRPLTGSTSSPTHSITCATNASTTPTYAPPKFMWMKNGS